MCDTSLNMSAFKNEDEAMGVHNLQGILEFIKL